MRVRTKFAVAAAAALTVAVGGVGIASATSRAGGQICRRTSDDALVARATCSDRGYASAPALAVKGAKGDTGPQGPRGPKGEDGDNAVIIRHARVAVSADYQAGTAAERTITISGLPAFAQSGALEVWSSNAGNVPDGLDADIAVTAQATGAGQTTRRFVVAANGFDHSESYELDVWVLAVAG